MAVDPSQTPAQPSLGATEGPSNTGGPLANLGRSVSAVLPPSPTQPQGASSGPSQHLSAGQFGGALRSAAGASEAGAAESASGLAAAL